MQSDLWLTLLISQGGPGTRPPPGVIEGGCGLDWGGIGMLDELYYTDQLWGMCQMSYHS